MLASRVVGRDLEIATLHDALERATGGQGSVLFLVGEPGIGKSRLAQVLAAHAAGAVYLSSVAGRCPLLRRFRTGLSPRRCVGLSAAALSRTTRRG